MSESDGEVLIDDPEAEQDDVSASEVQRAVVTSTDWTTETILSQMRRGNIQLNPRFQRRDAWTAKRKSLFIESLVLGLPIPQLVLAESRDRRGSFIVLDGKQRLLTLRQFAATEGDTFNTLRLSHLEVRPDLEGHDLESLEADPATQDAFDAFSNQTIRTVVVRAWPDEAFLDLVFLRLNTGSVQLSPQELRQALRPGPFTNFTDEFSADSRDLQAALRLDKPDFRMRDVEVVLRHFGFRFFLDDYRGNLKAFLDGTLEKLNASWPNQEGALREAGSELDAAIRAAFTVFEEEAFYRFDDGKGRYERRFNRAIFDVITWYASRSSEVRELMGRRPDDVETAFKELCADKDFRESITTTTKSVGATSTRLRMWGEALRDCGASGIEIPVLDGGRIFIP